MGSLGPRSPEVPVPLLPPWALRRISRFLINTASSRKSSKKLLPCRTTRKETTSTSVGKFQTRIGVPKVGLASPDLPQPAACGIRDICRHPLPPPLPAQCAFSLVLEWMRTFPADPVAAHPIQAQEESLPLPGPFLPAAARGHCPRCCAYPLASSDSSCPWPLLARPPLSDTLSSLLSAPHQPLQSAR